MSDLMQPLLAKVGTEYFLFGAAGAISLVAFAALILAPALGSFSRPMEKFAAGVLSLFVLAALILVGLVIGFIVFYNWDTVGV